MRRRILLIVVATLAIAACGHNRQGLSFNPNNGREAELTMPDGRVVMEVQGPPMQLQKLLSKLKGQFDIDRVEIEKMDPVPHERGFRVRGY